jgi:CRP/FNR family transcriptional regulator, anaerobic regulatory protein
MACEPTVRPNSQVTKCDVCAAAHPGLCSVLSAAQRDRLFAIARRRTVPANHYIFRDGEEANFFATILSGVVKLIKTTSDGEQHIIDLMYAPDFLGYTFGTSHRFSAVAATEVELCIFPRASFTRLMLEFPEMERWLFEFTARELDLCREWTLMLGRKSSYERVASLLLLIAWRGKHVGEGPASENSAEFEIPLTRSEVADYLGLTLETVSRMIGKLKQGGLIELRTSRDVAVPDIGRLADAARQDH